jgi:FixJ family two-component response regulator
VTNNLIQIIDDEPDIVRTLKQWIEADFPDYEIDAYLSCRLPVERPVILITDYLLPEKNGFDFLVENKDFYKNTNIIFFSAFDKNIQDDVEALRAMGLTVRIVQKPNWGCVFKEIIMQLAAYTICSVCGSKIFWLSNKTPDCIVCESCYETN